MASRITNWAQHYKNQQRRQQQAAAEGQSRPAPGLTPPSQEDAWVDRAVAAQKAREEAADQARAERHEEQPE